MYYRHTSVAAAAAGVDGSAWTFVFFPLTGGTSTSCGREGGGVGVAAASASPLSLVSPFIRPPSSDCTTRTGCVGGDE